MSLKSRACHIRSANLISSCKLWTGSICSYGLVGSSASTNGIPVHLHLVGNSPIEPVAPAIAAVDGSSEASR